ncbi:hypothetical protein CHS0354_001490 [Potamilus streckersoni]|uniref:Protein NRDE2 homolog n=1 Tax=Potamilus streckersoni TaxID=2493646 RepID=A0AAE0RW33_9BIVA|nr:hypothetical protein CHS0354_001490 [Potamilus streckersoni]
MEVEEDELFKHLFKISLFPVQSTVLADDNTNIKSSVYTGNTGELEWLRNKSYTSESAQRLAELQTEIKGLTSTLNQPKDNDANDVDGKGIISSSEENVDDIHEIKRAKKEKKHKKKHKKHKHHDRDVEVEEHLHEKEKSIRPELHISNKVFIEEIPELKPEHAWRIDRKPDINNITYGSIYKMHIPRYKLASYQILGATGNDRFLHFKNKHLQDFKENAGRYYDSKNRTILKSKEVEICLSESGISGSEKNYYPLSCVKDHSSDLNSKTMTLPRDNVRNKILDSTTLRFIQEKGAEDLKIVKEESDKRTNLQYPADKTAYYNKQLRETPHNISLWLEFVKFQDKKVEDLPQEVDVPKINIGAVFEKKVSILEKAVEANPGCIELKMALIELQSEKWESSEVNKELEKILFVHPANIGLWKFYLTFNQTRLSTSGVSRVTKLFHKCLKTLISIQEGRLQTHSIPDNIDENILDIFVQYCYYLKHAGHKEKAVASFQALIEMNMFCPSNLKSFSREDKILLFESFWDSNVARIGEANAKGWQYWIRTKDHVEQHLVPKVSVDNDEAEEKIISRKLPRWQTWLEIEVMRESNHWLPWQPDLTKNETEEDCEDIDRLVLFDDIKLNLFLIPTNLHFKLIVYFLQMLGVNFRSRLLGFQLPNSSLSAITVETVTDVCCQGIYAMENSLESKSEVQQNLITNLLQQCMSCFTGTEQTSLTLISLEHICSKFSMTNKPSKSDVKELRKHAKELLKEKHNRNNLPVWCAYVMLERIIGKVDEAKSILETALSMFSSDMKSDTPDINKMSSLWSLYRMYAEVLLEIQPFPPTALWNRQSAPKPYAVSSCLQVLFGAALGEKFNVTDRREVSNTSILRTRQNLKKLLEKGEVKLKTSDSQNTEAQRKFFIEVCNCYAIFEFCCSGIQSALIVYNGAFSSLFKLSNCELTSDNMVLSIHEDLLEYEIRLVLYQMSTHSEPLHILRNLLSSALDRFPNNPIFTSLFINVEQNSRIAGRLHRYFDRVTRDPTTPTPVVLAICSELSRLQMIQSSVAEMESTETGIMYRIRSVLERSLKSQALQHCPLMWKIYIQNEIRFGNEERARSVYYRALQQCPWVKSLCLEGVKLFGASQLQEIVDYMTEKEIRVQIPLEELDLLMSSEKE